jgi:hypothetical protein
MVRKLNKKEFLCDSCYYADITTVDYYKPIYANSSLVNKVKNLSIWCNWKSNMIQKLPTYREKNRCHYRPKAGKINNKLTQTTII